MKKKIIVSMLLAGSILCSSVTSHAASSATLNVGGKNTTINSTISSKSGTGYTGSDGTIYAKVSVTYVYKKGGTKRTRTNDSGYVYSIASAGCSAESGWTSQSITSTHEAIYKGIYNSGKTSATY